MTNHTSPMLEKLARTLEPQAWAALGTGDTLAYKNRRVSSVRKARKSLESLKDLDEGTVEAGIKQHNECTDGGTASAACVPEHVFAAMIDHILKAGEA